MQDTTQQDNWKRLAGEAAARLIEDGMVLGLGSCSTASFVVVGDVTKQVLLLGAHFPLPVEIVPFALPLVRRRLEALEAIVQLRYKEDQVFVTDNGNMILDCSFPGGIREPEELQTQLKSIAGVVETGLFLNMTERAIIGGPEGVKVVMGEEL